MIESRPFSEAVQVIQIVELEQEIRTCASNVCHNVIPGFQIAERAWTPRDIASVLRLLVAVQRSEFNDPNIGFSGVNIYKNNQEVSTPHLDYGFEGLAVHLNRGSERTVQLAHPIIDNLVAGKQPFRPPEQRFNCPEYDMSMIQNQIHNIHAGTTQANRLTVFSEGYPQTGTLPTVHYFSEGQHASWMRYGGARMGTPRYSDYFLECLVNEANL